MFSLQDTQFHRNRPNLPANVMEISLSSIPDNPDALLDRGHTAEALTKAGFKTAPATLATMATRGGGPPYQLFGPRVLYRWGSSLDWARSRLSKPRCSTSEGEPRVPTKTDANAEPPHKDLAQAATPPSNTPHPSSPTSSPPPSSTSSPVASTVSR
jgi:hypothetical protein